MCIRVNVEDARTIYGRFFTSSLVGKQEGLWQEKSVKVCQSESGNSPCSHC